MMGKNRKIQSQRPLTAIVNRLKKKGRAIVTFNGSFDILHIGHIRALQEAKAQGDILIVLLNSDSSIKRYKGSSRPINPQKYRAEFLASLSCVDYITIFNELTPSRILDKIKPHIHCNGSDWGKYCIERKVVEKNSGRLYFPKWTLGYSSSRLLARVTSNISHPPSRAVFLDRDGTINDDSEGYTYQKKRFHFKIGVIPALRRLSKTNYKIFIITNQSGVARSYYTKAHVEKLHSWLIKTLIKKGIRIDKIYYCPHMLVARCVCRKPEIGMILRAQKEFDLDLSKSWVVGDNKSDVLTGKKANLKTIFIGREDSNKWADIRPHHHTPDLTTAVKIIIKDPQ